MVTPPSPLTQGRELKHLILFLYLYVFQSPLTQGRELKHSHSPRSHLRIVSPLTQGRELKQYFCHSW